MTRHNRHLDRSRSDTSLGARQRFRYFIQPAERVLQQSKHCGGQDFPWRAALRQFLACCPAAPGSLAEWNTISSTNLRRGQQQKQQWRQVVLNGAGSSPNPCALDVLDLRYALQQDVAHPPLPPDVGPRGPHAPGECPTPCCLVLLWEPETPSTPWPVDCPLGNPFQHVTDRGRLPALFHIFVFPT